MKKRTLRVDFVSFWPNFIKTDNYFYHLLNSKYNIKIDTISPEIVFHSYDYSGNQEHKKYNKNKTLKVFYSGENVEPNFTDSHFTFTYKNIADNRNMRLPLWVLHINWFNIRYKKNRDIGYHINLNSLLNKKQKINKNFCSFIASQPKGNRVEFFQKLNSIQKIDSGGRLLNNIDKQVKGRGDQHWKYNFLKNYKFNIAFENTIDSGYVSEKIIQPMSVNSIPIYWGDEEAKKDFNVNSFIFVNDFQNEKKLFEYIIELKNNNNLLEEKMMEPWFLNNTFPEKFHPNTILDYFENNILLLLK